MTAPKVPAIVREFNALFSQAPTASTSPEAAFNRLLRAVSLPTAGRPGKALIEARQARIRQRSPRHLEALTHVEYPPSAHLIPGLHPTPTQLALWQRATARQGLTPREHALRHAAALCAALGLSSKDADVQELAREQALRQFALSVGEGYHVHVDSLYRSSRARVVYGTGGERESDNTIYRGSYKGWYANWQHAGARIEGEEVILENYRGTEKLRLPLPPDADRARILFSPGLLLDGDLWAVERHAGIYERYGLHHRHLVRTGYAVRYAAYPQSGQPYYEHGASLETCHTEYERKLALQTPAQRATVREQRMARLIAQCCGALVITYADARSVGYCDAGILGFCQRHGIDPDEQATLAQLRATKDARVQRVIEAAALRLATRRLAAHA